MIDNNSNRIRDDQIGRLVESFHDWISGESSI